MKMRENELHEPKYIVEEMGGVYYVFANCSECGVLLSLGVSMDSEEGARKSARCQMMRYCQNCGARLEED